LTVDEKKTSTDEMADLAKFLSSNQKRPFDQIQTSSSSSSSSHSPPTKRRVTSRPRSYISSLWGKGSGQKEEEDETFEISSEEEEEVERLFIL